MKPAFDSVVFQTVFTFWGPSGGGYSRLHDKLCTIMDNLCKLFLKEVDLGGAEAVLATLFKHESSFENRRLAYFLRYDAMVIT